MRQVKHFVIERPSAQLALKVNVCDFGAIADRGACNGEPFRKALEFCRQSGASHLVIPQGTYYFHNDPQTGAYLDLDGFEDFTIEGNGSELLFGRPKSYLRIRNGRRIHITDLILDWNWDVAPLSSVGVVTALDSRGALFEMSFPSYENIPEQWPIRIVGPFDPLRYTPGSQGGIEFRPYRKELPPTKENGETDARMETMVRELSNVILGMEKVGSSTMRFYAMDPAWTAKRLKTGQVYHLRHYEYDTVAIMLEDSRHTTINNVTLYSCPGSGIVGNGNLSHLHVLNSKITVRPGTDRAISTTADCFHIRNSQGFIIIENCDFGYAGDDCINIHDNTSMGVQRINDNSLIAFRVSKDSVLFETGDTVELRHPDLSPMSFQSELTAVCYDESLRNCELTFKDRLPEGLVEDTILFNTRFATRHFIIRNNRFANNRARGLLIHGSDGIVEHNVFDNIQGAAIQIETGCEVRWSEGTGVRNVTIRNNQFRNCDLNAWQMAVLYMGVYLPGGRTAYPIFENIRIEGNTFVNCPRMAMFLSSCRNVQVVGNAIVNANQIPLDSPTYGSSQQEKPVYGEQYSGTIYLLHASGVEISGNKCLSTIARQECGIAWDPATTRNITIRDNVGFN